MFFSHSVHIFCSLITHLISGLILVRPSLNHLTLAILSSRNDPFRNVRSLHKPSFRAGLPRTACESVCLSVEKMTPFAKIFDKSAMFDMVERKLRLYYVSAVFPIARD